MKIEKIEKRPSTRIQNTVANRQLIHYYIIYAFISSHQTIVLVIFLD